MRAGTERGGLPLYLRRSLLLRKASNKFSRLAAAQRPCFKIARDKPARYMTALTHNRLAAVGGKPR